MTTLAWHSQKTFGANLSPYVDWVLHEGARNEAQLYDASELFRDTPTFLAKKVTADTEAGRISDDWSLYSTGENADEAIRAIFAGGDAVPVPKHAINKNASNVIPFKTSDIVGDMPTDIPQGTVLVGVIDTGIPLGLTRFRQHQDPKKTRIISAWQQTASFKGKSYLPFGDEIYASEIDEEIRKNTKSGRLDEDAFNRALELVQPHLPDGQRDLDFAAAHGAHVADLATGFDPFLQAEADDYRMIVVNLPTQRIHGSAGNFLAHWALYAVERILNTAQALWEANKDRYDEVDVEGYPIAINFSYGMQAGPKDGLSVFENALSQILAKHESEARAPARIIMPAGNDNTERGHARIFLGKDETWTGHGLAQEVSLPWHIKPDDQTANFVELWLSAPPRGAGVRPAKDQIDPNKIELFLTPPGHQEIKVPNLIEGQFSELGNFARVYRRRDALGRVAYVMCVARTFGTKSHHSLAPAGAWTIKVKYTGAAANAAFYIQSDQSGLIQSSSGRRSYFETTGFVQRDERGRLRDSFDFDYGHTDNWEKHGPIQIKGTLNALATAESVISIGGFRQSDGKPAIYSATSDGDSYRPAQIEVVDASFPSELAPTHFGLLASGSKDGSSSLLRGTSMATGLATRFLANELSDWRGADKKSDLGGKKFLRSFAADNISTRPNLSSKQFRPINSLKMGVGRVVMPPHLNGGRINRF